MKSSRAALQRLDILADPTCLFLAIPVANQPNLFAFFFSRPKRLTQPILIAGYHARRSRQNMRGRAIVLFQTHHFGPREILFKPQDIADLGPAPAIDRLIIITHTTDILVLGRQQAQPQILRDIGVLIFVHKDEPEPTLVLFQDIRMGLKNHHHMQQQIAKIHRVQGFQAVLILFINLGAAIIIGRRFRTWHFVRRPGAVLPIVNQMRHHSRRPALFVDVFGPDQLLQQAHLIVGVQNGEV